MDTVKQDLREYVHAAWDTVVDEIRLWGRFVRETWKLLSVFFVVLALLLWWARPFPPTHVVMGKGSVGGSYETLTKKYAAYFARHGITLELVESAGAEENVLRLKDKNDPMMAAFVQGGLIDAKQVGSLQSLGSVDYEPIWIFYRRDHFDTDNVLWDQLISKPMAIGAVGSGTHTQVLHILALNDMPLTDTYKTMASDQSVAAFQRGEISSLVIVDGFESKNVQTLIKDPNAGLMTFHRANAYRRLKPFFHVVTVPMGSFNLAKNQPPQDLELLAVTTNLIIDPRLHPAIQILFLKAATEINGGRSFFTQYHEFPSFQESVITESSIAENFYTKGQPWLMDYLPFWLASFVNRIALIIIPLGAFAYPLLREMPGYRLSRARGRINQIYAKLRAIEQNLFQDYDPEKHEEYLTELESIEAEAMSLRVPKALMSDYFSLRTSIDYIQVWLDKKHSSQLNHL